MVLLKMFFHLKFIDNSIKYCSQKSTINISVDFSNDQKSYVIKILDNGFGVDEDEMQKIFEPFYRGKNAQDKTIPGTG